MTTTIQNPPPVSDTRRTSRPPKLVSPRELKPSATLISVKFLMAITGAGLVLFVTAHLAGNLQIYQGQDALNGYAQKLKGMPILLWTARIGLVAVFTTHVGLALYLKRVNRRARPTSYMINSTIQTTLASRTMLTSGLVIFAFVIYHLLHFTLGVTDPAAHHLVDTKGRHDVYSMVVTSFKNPYVASAYIVAMIFLGLHLSHAASSIFQTLGMATHRTRRLLHRSGIVLAVFIMLGNISIPVCVILGLVGLPGEGGAR